MDELRTEIIREDIEQCETLEDFENEIFPVIKNQREQWSVRIKDIIDKSGYTQDEFGKLCNVSRQTISAWRKGALPRQRELFIRIGLVAQYDVEGINALLQRFGRYPALYPKSLEDCICIYVANKKLGKDAIELYDEIRIKIKSNIIRLDESESGTIETLKFGEKLSDVKDIDELEKFIDENIKVFTSVIHKFNAYAKAQIMENMGGSSSVAEMSYAQNWSPSLSQAVSFIRQNKWYPTRNKVISLGLHLGMEHDEIDELLSYANMERLCAKNVLESIIMFAVNDAVINIPLEEQCDDTIYMHTGDILRQVIDDYSKKYTDGIYDLSELALFANELGEKEE